MNNKHIITSEDSDEVREFKLKQRDLEKEKWQRGILNMCMNKDSRSYLVRKLKTVLLNCNLCVGDPEGTGYNLGKADAYKEILRDIQSASQLATEKQKKVISEMLTEIFFNEEDKQCQQI